MEKVSLSSFSTKYDLPKTTVYRKCEELRIPTSNGLSPDDCDRLLSAFGLSKPVTPASAPPAEVSIEIGNHQITIAPPQLPQTFTLEGLRTVDAIAMEDPLAVAQQFIGLADNLIGAMNADVRQREQRLSQTKQAADQIASKRTELELETRLYRLQTTTLDANLSDTTSNLTEDLAALQKLGKPVVGGSAPE